MALLLDQYDNSCFQWDKEYKHKKYVFIQIVAYCAQTNMRAIVFRIQTWLVRMNRKCIFAG